MTAIPHSRDLKTMLIVFGVVEIVLAWPISLIFPPAWKPVHAVAEVLIIVAMLGFAITLIRRPHMVTPEALVLKAGLKTELAVPATHIAAVRAEERTVKGGGLRVEDSEGVCASGQTTSVVLDLHEPIVVKDVEVHRVRFGADEPSHAVREIRRITIAT